MISYYSQYGQDKFIYENIFSDKNNGFFVDIGAYDGIRLSNTCFFENLGWTGYCFEPIPEVFDKLVKNRPWSDCFNNAVGHENKKVDFLKVTGEAEMLSGVLDYYDAQHMFRINKETFESKGTQEGISVQMVTLADVLQPGVEIDYLSIDTEGGEPKILENILKDFTPEVISVEVNYQSEYDSLMKIMSSKYDVIKQMGCDLILKAK